MKFDSCQKHAYNRRKSKHQENWIPIAKRFKICNMSSEIEAFFLPSESSDNPETAEGAICPDGWVGGDQEGYSILLGY